ncbi:MAG: hypothetical protein MZW92_07020 [Comamonadaceae bacterium]|nr:hypothetical protein [Comamonadaceae bacterium]
MAERVVGCRRARPCPGSTARYGACASIGHESARCRRRDADVDVDGLTIPQDALGSPQLGDRPLTRRTKGRIAPTHQSAQIPTLRWHSRRKAHHTTRHRITGCLHHRRDAVAVGGRSARPQREPGAARRELIDPSGRESTFAWRGGRWAAGAPRRPPVPPLARGLVLLLLACRPGRSSCRTWARTNLRNGHELSVIDRPDSAIDVRKCQL